MDRDMLEHKGKVYNLRERGPCCDYHDELQAKYKMQLKVLHALLGKQATPRLFLQIYEIQKRAGTSPYVLEFALSDKCYCNDVPDSPIFRRFMAKFLDRKEEGIMKGDFGSVMDQLEGLAQETLAELPEGYKSGT